MKHRFERTILMAAVMAMIIQGTGCALTDVATKTADGDAKMDLGEYKGLKHAIGCKDFDNQAGWSGAWKLGNNLSIMLESALFDTKRFVIVEREKLGAIIAEQDLVASGRAAKAKKVAQTGMIRPARYIATGAITVVEEAQSGGSGGISLGPISLGGGKSKAQITIIAKLIDTTTSQLVAKKQIVGKAGRVSMNVGVHMGGVGVNMDGFKKTPIGEAAQDCINQAAIFFAKEMENVKFDATVIKVSGKQILINRGSSHGLQAGQSFAMVEAGELILDPDTGETLGQEKGKTLGMLKVARVDEKMSYCDVVSGEKNPKPGTVVIQE